MATHGVFGFPGTAPPILCRLQVAILVARSQALTERTSWCLVGWNPAVVSAGDTASDLFARPHFISEPAWFTWAEDFWFLTEHSPAATTTAVRFNAHTVASTGLQARSRLTKPHHPGARPQSYPLCPARPAWARCRMDPMGRRRPPGPQSYSFLRVKLEAHHSSGAISSPNRSAPAQLQPGVTFQQ